MDGDDEKMVAGVYNVKTGVRLFPILTCIGRNIGRPRLAFNKKLLDKSEIVELWPSGDLDLKKNSLAYCILVCNPHIDFVIHDAVPRKYFSLKFQYLQIVFIYWLFNMPTKFSGTVRIFPTPNGYVNGFEFLDAINFTTYATLQHMEIYPSLPEL